MLERFSMILFLLVFMLGCRSERETTVLSHFSDTTHVFIYDTLKYEGESTTIILEPKNDPIFESTTDIKSGINSDNYVVKTIEVKSDVLRGFQAKDIQTDVKTEKVSETKENTVKNVNPERTSLRVIFAFMWFVALVLFVLIIYEKLKFKGVRRIASEFQKYDVHKWTY